MKVLVCGGRDFIDAGLLDSTLDKLHKNERITTIVHGAAKGADTLAGEWAAYNEIPEYRFHAKWKVYGKSAGAIRNKDMLDEWPGMLVAFPGGAGTGLMKKLAEQREVRIFEVENDT